MYGWLAVITEPTNPVEVWMPDTFSEDPTSPPDTDSEERLPTEVTPVCTPVAHAPTRPLEAVTIPEEYRVPASRSVRYRFPVVE
jgi:hypothetical protein